MDIEYVDIMTGENLLSCLSITTVVSFFDQFVLYLKKNTY